MRRTTYFNSSHPDSSKENSYFNGNKKYQSQQHTYNTDYIKRPNKGFTNINVTESDTLHQPCTDLTPDARTQAALSRMVRCNTLTISSHKAPEYYLKLIRFHFTKSEDEVLILQALGLSC